MKKISWNLVIICVIFMIFIVNVVAIPYISTIIQNSDDGTELNGSLWYESGYKHYALNCMGKDENGDKCDVGFRFNLEELNQGDKITYARLRFSAMGSEIDSSLKLVIEGVLDENAKTFSQDNRPSQNLPKTNSNVWWEINEKWGEGIKKDPLWYYTPNIAPIINEVLSLQGWGSGSEGKYVVITIKDVSNPNEINFVKFDDFESKSIPNVELEIYETVHDTFLGKEMLGRVSDNSATVNLYSLIDTSVYVEYGTLSGNYNGKVYPMGKNGLSKAVQRANAPIEIKLENLEPNTQYYYRIRYKKPENREYIEGEERTFNTQKPKGEQFSFAILSDEHAGDYHLYPTNEDDIELYKTTLQNVASSSPDFYISLGDFAEPEYYLGRDSYNLQEAIDRYLIQRKYIDEIAHSIPFYLVLGNHEGEQGWYYYFENDDINNLAAIALKARRDIIPNPYPDGFYTGNVDKLHGDYREDYYSWEWGDALFVVLDPYHYTKRKPHDVGEGGFGTHNNWDWTLGKEQYDWLYDTLHESDAKWKFVFTHHLVSSNNGFYGRGGIEAAKYKVDNKSSYEWGGESPKGKYVFHNKRPGWDHGPIHDMLVGANVTIVFHGHDHFFAKQDLDGIVYLECPKSGNSDYSYGFKTNGKYIYGDFLPNSGHINVTVDPEFVNLEYVRSYLPGDGNNGEVAYNYTIN